MMTFNLRRGARLEARTVSITAAAMAGWTGRDAAAVEAHIHELALLGVKPPERTPMFYPVPAAAVTNAGVIQADPLHSSGEVEMIAVGLEDGLWVGVGSDHTDRMIERKDVLRSKRTCPKPVARELWALDDVLPHWDQLVIRSRIKAGEEWITYQEGTLSALLPLDRLLIAYAGKARSLPIGEIMFCGTIPAEFPAMGTPDFAFECRDPVQRRTIGHRYQVQRVD